MSKQAAWQPDKDYVKTTRLYEWMTELGIDEYDAFLAKSQDDIAWFWGSLDRKLDVRWRAPYTSVIADPKKSYIPTGFLTDVSTLSTRCWSAGLRAPNMPRETH